LLVDETAESIRFLLSDWRRLLQAFERELLTLLPRLRRFARALARDAADSDDLIQVALERALKARDQWAPGTRLDSWMMKIVRNCWIDEMRSRTRRARTFVPEEEGASVGSEAHREIEIRAELRDVERAMNSLSPEQREVIALVLVEGLAYKEAADLLDIPIGTLTSRLTRGRQALAHMLEAA
jgi:RNA polymerase sigma factor (sigma-70 family)